MMNNTCFRNLPQFQTKLEELLPIPSRAQISAAGGFSMAAEMSFPQPHDEQTMTHQLLQFSACIDRHLPRTSGFGNESVHGDFSQTLGEHLDIYSLDFPIFNGSNPRMWIKQCNNFFELFPKISDVQRIDLAIWNFEGKAFSWILELPIDDVLAISWKQFCEIVCSRFYMLKVSHDEDALVVIDKFDEKSSPPYQGFEQYVSVTCKGRIDDDAETDENFELAKAMEFEIPKGAIEELSDGVTIFKEKECIFEVKATTVDTHHGGEEKNVDVGGIALVKGVEELENVLTSWDPGDSIVVVNSSLSEIIYAPQEYEYSMNMHTGITGFLDNGRVKRACEFFRDMPERDDASLHVMVSELIQNDDLYEARMLFEYGEEGEERNYFIHAYNTLIAGYGRKGRVVDAWPLFDKIPLSSNKGNGHMSRFERNMVSWNSIIMAYVKSKNMSSAWELFYEMENQDTCRWNDNWWNMQVSSFAMPADQGDLTTGQVLRGDIPWETYTTTKLIMGTELQLLQRYDKKPKNYKAQLLDDDVPAYVDVFVNIFHDNHGGLEPNSNGICLKGRNMEHEYPFATSGNPVMSLGISMSDKTVAARHDLEIGPEAPIIFNCVFELSKGSRELVLPGCFLMDKAIGLMPMIDQGEKDDKIIVVFVDAICTAAALVINTPEEIAQVGTISANGEREIGKLLEKVGMKRQIPLLIVAVESEALATLIINKLQVGLKICAIKAPGFGDNRMAFLKDLAAMAGGEVITKDLGMDLENFTVEMFGSCKKATVSKDDAVILVEHSLLDKNIVDLARVTYGFVGSDLAAICIESALVRLSSDPRGRGSSLGGGSVMAYVDMDYDGDGVKKERSLLVGTEVDLVKNVDDGLKYVYGKFYLSILEDEDHINGGVLSWT